MNYELIEESNRHLSDGTKIKWNRYRGDLAYNRYSDIIMLSNLFLLLSIIIIISITVPSNIYIVLLFSSLGIFNILFSFQKYNVYRTYYNHWIKVPVKIIEVWVDEYHLIKATNSIFCPRVKFTYNFRNSSYLETKLAHDKFDYCKQSERSAIQALEKLKCQKLFAWVDPIEPDNAVLNNDMSKYQHFQYIFTLLCGTVFFHMVNLLCSSKFRSIIHPMNPIPNTHQPPQSNKKTKFLKRTAPIVYKLMYNNNNYNSGIKFA